MRTIDARKLNDRMRRDDDTLVINVLSEDSFEKEHIPGSHNVPGDRNDFVAQVERLAGRKDRPIVMHCSDATCKASHDAARKLENEGFTNVTHFKGGIAEWKLAELDLESGAPATTR